MAFKPVGARKYFKYSECKPGQVLVGEGSFMGSEQGLYGVQHLFKEKTGDVVCLNSAGQLNWLVDNHLKPGAVCKVTYVDKKPLTKGQMKGKEAHSFSLEVDDDQGQPVKVESPKAPTVLGVASDIDDITL